MVNGSALLSQCLRVEVRVASLAALLLAALVFSWALSKQQAAILAYCTREGWRREVSVWATSTEGMSELPFSLTQGEKRNGLRAEYLGARMKQGGLGGSVEDWPKLGGQMATALWLTSPEHVVHYAEIGQVEVSVSLLRNMKVPSKAFVV